MRFGFVARPTSAVRRAQRADVAMLFGISVKAREPWGPVHSIHLHRLIAPRNATEITGGLDAIHCRIHTHVVGPGKHMEETLAKHARSTGKRDQE